MRLKELNTRRKNKMTNTLEMKKKYDVVERFFTDRKDITNISSKAVYVGDINFLGEHYYCFAYKGAKGGEQKVYLPSAKRYETWVEGNVVGIKAIKQGTFEREDNKIITSPNEEPVLIIFNDGLSESNGNIAKGLLKILNECELI